MPESSQTQGMAGFGQLRGRGGGVVCQVVVPRTSGLALKCVAADRAPWLSAACFVDRSECKSAPSSCVLSGMPWAQATITLLEFLGLFRYPIKGPSPGAGRSSMGTGKASGRPPVSTIVEEAPPSPKNMGDVEEEEG